MTQEPWNSLRCSVVFGGKSVGSFVTRTPGGRSSPIQRSDSCLASWLCFNFALKHDHSSIIHISFICRTNYNLTMYHHSPIWHLKYHEIIGILSSWMLRLKILSGWKYLQLNHGRRKEDKQPLLRFATLITWTDDCLVSSFMSTYKVFFYL